jgi:hypothetical protein
VLQKHYRPAGNCKIKKEIEEGVALLLTSRRSARFAAAPGVESLIKDGASLKH